MNQSTTWNVAQGLPQTCIANLVKRTLNISLQGCVQLARKPSVLQGIVCTASETKAMGLKPRFPAEFKHIFDPRLSHSIDSTGHAQRTSLTLPFGKGYPSCGLHLAEWVAAHLMLHQLVAFCRRAGKLAVHSRRSFAWLILGDSPYKSIQISSTAQHQLHQAAYPIGLLQLARAINTTSEVPHSVHGGFAANVMPHARRCAGSDAWSGAIFHPHSVPLPRLIVEDPREVGSLSCRIATRIPGFTPGRRFLPPPLPAGEFRRACAWPTRCQDPIGLTAFRIRDHRA